MRTLIFSAILLLSVNAMADDFNDPAVGTVSAEQQRMELGKRLPKMLIQVNRKNKTYIRMAQLPKGIHTKEQLTHEVVAQLKFKRVALESQVSSQELGINEDNKDGGIPSFIAGWRGPNGGGGFVAGRPGGWGGGGWGGGGWAGGGWGGGGWAGGGWGGNGWVDNSAFYPNIYTGGSVFPYAPVSVVAVWVTPQWGNCICGWNGGGWGGGGIGWGGAGFGGPGIGY